MTGHALSIAVASVIFLTLPGTADDDGLSSWFNSGRCAAFDGATTHEPPYVKSGHDDLVVRIPTNAKKSLPVPGYVYDPRAGIAYRHIGQDSGIQDTLRFAGKPPVAVPQTMLSPSGTKSGLKLGARAASVVSTLGKPLILKACGLQRYVYLRERNGAPDELDFTISRGRVVQIFSTLDG